MCFSIITVNKLLKTFSLVSFFLHEKKSFTQSALKKSVSCSLKSEMKVTLICTKRSENYEETGSETQIVSERKKISKQIRNFKFA